MNLYLRSYYPLKFLKVLGLFILVSLNFILCGCSGCSKSGIINARNKNINYVSNSSSYSNPNNKNVLVKMRLVNGVYMVPVEINGLQMEFIFDTGASDITLSAVEAIFLYKQGKLTDNDIKGTRQYQIADGTIAEGTIINLRRVKIGSKILENVEASIVNNLEAPLLIGQSALSRFGSITIDYNMNVIRFDQ